MITETERGGAASVEAAIAAIGVTLLLAFGIAAGRLTAADAAVTEAASAAARIASAERDPTQARAQATDAARGVLAAQNLSCASMDVTVDVPASPVGTVSAVTTRVRCAVRWSDLGLPGAPGSREITETFTSSVDRYRERQ